jgi:hypothetical protein
LLWSLLAKRRAIAEIDDTQGRVAFEAAHLLHL